MKRHLLSFLLMLCVITFTQAQFTQTQGFNYKALITNNGNALSNQSVTIRFNILENGTTSVYQETQSVTTDANGIAKAAIGEGNPLNGNFTNIDWASNIYFLKVEINTGSGYQDFGTSELKAVPFAKFANRVGIADNINGIPVSTTTPNNGQVLKYNGSAFVPADINTGGSSVTKIDDLSDAKSDSDGSNDGSSVFLGKFAGQNDDSSDNRNAGLGFNALSSNTTGNNNVAIGYESMNHNNTGFKNVAVGSASLTMNTSGHDNVASGYYALSSNNTGHDNVAVGSGALKFNTNGIKNTAVGSATLQTITTGDENTAVGFAALLNNTANNNTAVGSTALYSNSTGSENTAVGQGSLNANGVGQGNSALGWLSLEHNTSGTGNTAIGNSALNANTDKNENTAVGALALYQSNGNYNVAVGSKAAMNSTAATFNTALGYKSLYNNSTGGNNCAVGDNALSKNTGGSNNTAIGSDAYFFGSGLNNTTCIGYGAGGQSDVDNRIEVGNASVSWIGGQVTWSTYSDQRIKTHIKNDVAGLDFIKRLRPVTYNLDIHQMNKMTARNGKVKDLGDWPSKYDIEKIKMTGFIAQEVEQAAKDAGYEFSGVQKAGDDAGLYSVSYAQFVVPLVKAVQEQQDTIEQQQQEIDRLKQQNAQLLQLQDRMANMEQKLNNISVNN